MQIETKSYENGGDTESGCELMSFRLPSRDPTNSGRHRTIPNPDPFLFRSNQYQLEVSEIP
jgi:hypothetical protein